MRSGIASAPALRLARPARTSRARCWRIIGLTIAVAVPVAFWTFLIALLGAAFDVAISPVVLAMIAGAIGLICALGAAVVMGEGARRTA